MRNTERFKLFNVDRQKGESLNPALGSKQGWTKEELEAWKLWEYDRVGFLLNNLTLPRPRRQYRAGMPDGLSILVDPNLRQCPFTVL